MATHSSAPVRDETSHVIETTQIAISKAVKRRARTIVNDRSIDPQWRNIIRYALEINDPWLDDLVRRTDAGKTTIEAIDFSQTVEAREDDPDKEKVEALAEIVCGAGDEPAAALFVLMGTLEHSAQPKLLANAAKHLAFTHCGQSNLYGVVDLQLANVESELLAGTTDNR